MHTITDIPAFARKHKGTLLRGLVRGYAPYALGRQLQLLQKHQLNALVLLTLERPADLGRLLGMPLLELEELINHPQYTSYSIPKKKGGERRIAAPDGRLKVAQKRLNFFLQAYYLWIKPEEVHGFVINPRYLRKKCNIAENAAAHAGKKQVLNIDLKDFFPSISAKRVKQLFVSPYFNFAEPIANALALLTTFERHLPIGSPSSPVIANFVCLALDSDLREWAAANGWTYTRYADDLTFSSDTTISKDSILDTINVIGRHGFTINGKKLRLAASNRRQTVTGLTVNKQVNVDRRLLKKIRAMLHDLTANGVGQAARRHFGVQGEVGTRYQTKFMNRLEGYINFVGQVRGKDDALYLRYRKHLTAAQSNQRVF